MQVSKQEDEAVAYIHLYACVLSGCYSGKGLVLLA